jgi:hypothetical protein
MDAVESSVLRALRELCEKSFFSHKAHKIRKEHKDFVWRLARQDSQKKCPFHLSVNYSIMTTENILEGFARVGRIPYVRRWKD